VVCDEHVVAIGVNLVEALFYLRVEGEDRSIWVDALCINQDLNERSIQVAEMARIYQRAQRVIAFIGPEIGWEETAFTFLHELSERYYEESEADDRFFFQYQELALHQPNLNYVKSKHIALADAAPAVLPTHVGGSGDCVCKGGYCAMGQ
jgi:Heterokaryon incompatibility protein (HET)